MIKKIKLVWFRSFENISIDFEEKTNLIIWENWKWKTNILEAINLLCTNSETNISMQNIVNKNSESFFVQWIFEDEKQNENEISISYEKSSKKKKIILNKKATTKSKIGEYNDKSIYFSPLEMNLFYLWPSLRRDFLDNLISNTKIEYSKKLKAYENVIKNRNRVLKNIFEEKSKKEEIKFWDEKMISLSKEIYAYRIKAINYFRENIKEFSEYFFWKVSCVEFEYKSKTDLENIEYSIKKYLDENLDRDIILKKTQIWPHIDDFSIIIDWIELIDFASRWEIKSVILWLKLLELKYLEIETNKKPILLIDDFLSELDEKHKNILLDEIRAYQCIISSIKDIEKIEWNKIFL